MIREVPVNRPLITKEDVHAVAACVESGWISGESPVVEEFESNFAKSVGSKYAIAMSSGTAALDAVFAALNIGVNDEVILPSFTIISCIQQIVRLGARPVLVDSNPDDWNMSLEQTLQAITKRTRAILAVHTYGLAAQVPALREICASRNIALIEDAAEAHGLKMNNDYCGTIGDAGIFSFYANKTITTGEGGMVVTDSSSLRDRLTLLRNLAFTPNARFVHEELGWNFRMSSMQAALGSSQLKRIDSLVARKREIGARYTAQLSDLRDVSLPAPQNGISENSYWVFGLLLGKSHQSLAEVRNELSHSGIGTRPFFCPMHLQPALRSLWHDDQIRFPVAEELWERGFYLPSGMGITDEEVDYVCSKVKEVLK